MSSHFTIALLALLLSRPTLATPDPQKCSGQSCAIAKLSGSTPEIFNWDVDKAPSGGDAQGDACIQEHYTKLHIPSEGTPPAPRPASASGDGGLASLLGGLLGFTKKKEKRFERAGAVASSAYAPPPTLRARQACKPHTLLFAKGTLEFGDLGMTFGPVLQSAVDAAMPGEWSIKGVQYDNGLAGDWCIGLPGGYECLQQLNALAKQCPQTKFVLGGYSQGAMVAHVCTAFADEAIRQRIKAVVVVGDPFNGAAIKDYPSDRVKTFCNSNDGVCSGEFNIGVGHLSYSSTTAQEAVDFIKQKINT